ncbi:baseplate J/gp47 family protein [Candidatus Saccharibacteria bacterium]|nr:baseplate J/gp47 family protein [Candidatus Saccharibacteria bacterium]MCL1963410.1 baseplate J/gp47 family protein [Candidatus Saccharibacteria bacterium]
MNKLQGRDTIYIDADDDITSIIGKIKRSESSVVALVPPKRIGALQSVVNLKLLLRSAKAHRKTIAMITTDPALTSLATGLRIPIARNLTSQTEILESAMDDDDADADVIDGKDVAEGEISRLSGGEKIARRDNNEDKEISAAVAAIETDDKVKNDKDGDGKPDVKPDKTERKTHVPNFNKFRKILLLGGGALILIIGFLIWAIGFAPNATITIMTKTRAVSVNGTVKLQNSSPTNIDQNIIQPVVKQIKESEPVEFIATGEKEIGEKASGSVEIVNQTGHDITFPAGTSLRSSNGYDFTLNETVSIRAAEVIGGVPQFGQKIVSITAVKIGEEYNLPAGSMMSISGGGAKVIVTVDSEGLAGGSKKTVKVVSEADVEKVAEKIKKDAKDKEYEMIGKLKKQMGDSATVVDGSFAIAFGDIAAKPKIGESAENTKATVTIEVTYTLIGLSNTDLENWLTMMVEKEADIKGSKTQRVYNTGLSQVKFEFSPVDSTVEISTASARVGASLDEKQIKKDAVGKRSGQIKEDIERKNGVEKVNVDFAPFWVSSAPSEDKITIKFVTDDK